MGADPDAVWGNGRRLWAKHSDRLKARVSSFICAGAWRFGAGRADRYPLDPDEQARLDSLLDS